MVLTTTKATAVGLMAPVLWGMSVGLVRTVTVEAGIAGGVCLMNLIAATLLMFVFGFPKFSDYPKKYLAFGLTAALLCELCFPISMGLCQTSRETIEVGMVNYAWPCLTVLFAILFNGQASRWWVVIGLVVAFTGMAMVLSGDGGLNPGEIAANVGKNPAPYILAFTGAVAWATYCSITRGIGIKKNPVVLIFLGNTLVYGTPYLCGFGERFVFSFDAVKACLIAGCVMASGYAVWNVGIISGRMTILAIASYFTPVLSCLFASMYLIQPLTLSFFKGVGLVVAGSLVCWAATRRGKVV